MDFDLVIAGGGIAGLTAAAAFGANGFRVLIVDPTPPVTHRDAEGADLRTTAFLQPARAFLESAGLWDRLAPFAMPLEKMRIIDAGGPTPVARVDRAFESHEISDAPFGWNLSNWLLRREMAARLEELSNVTFLAGVRATGLFTRTGEARVRLSNGTTARCKLVIACDGRNSTLRDAAGIGVKTQRFGQKALAFAVTHTLPHENVSTEVHRTGGPFTLVPLPDADGTPSSAVVWMDDGPKSAARMKLSEAAFEAEMTERSTGLLGPLKLVSKRSIWPIISQQADSLYDERLALVAEAAHVLPPIGAQGLNLSLKDVATLLDLAVKAPETIGSQEMLLSYQKARMPDVRMRVAGISLLNRTSQHSAPVLRDARARGIEALHGIAPVRHALMRMGLGTRD